MTSFAKTPRNRLRRRPERAAYDSATIYSILDEARVCHVGFCIDDQPFVIPTLHARDGDSLLLHGAAGSRMMQHIAAGRPLSIAVTLLDALVLARSIFAHSVNYRSVVLFARGELLEDAEQKLRALQIISEHILPGRWQEARPPDDKELAATAVARLEIDSATAKIRSGPPADAVKDRDLDVWAGVVPLQTQLLAPEPAPDLNPDIPLSPALRRLQSGNSP